MTCIVNGSARLHTIDICDCFEITSQFMTAIAAHCPTLTKLSTNNTNMMLADAGLVALAEGCRFLEEISLTEDIASVGNAVFDSIGQHCSRLRKINLYMGFTITDDGFLSLLLGCPKIEYISLIVAPQTSGTKGVVSAVDVSKSRSCRACPHLIEIILHKCDELTDLTLFNIRDCCNALVNLSICECICMTESCVDEVMAALPHLSE
jgi:F-box and leucine-rich repeat protein 2/20